MPINPTYLSSQYKKRSFSLGFHVAPWSPYTFSEMPPSNQRSLVAVAPQGDIKQPVVDYIWNFLRLPKREHVDFASGASGLLQLVRSIPINSLGTIYSDGIAWEVATHIGTGEQGELELNSKNLGADRLVKLLVKLIQIQGRRHEQATRNAIMVGVLEAHSQYYSVSFRFSDLHLRLHSYHGEDSRDADRYNYATKKLADKIISSPDPPPRRGWGYRPVQLHQHCHAFASRLYRKGVLADDMLLVQAMREAFEVTNPEANIHLTLVAVWSWLTRRHDHFVSRITRKKTTERGSSVRYSTGELYHALGGLPRLDEARWNFWKSRFLELTDGRYGEAHQLRESAVNMHQFAVPAPVTGP